MLDVPRWRLTRTISLVTARGVPLTPMAERFRGLLRDAFRPRQVEAPPNSNLPAPLTSLVGRDAEIGAVVERVRAGRLVTLTGAGGSGKTRLAVEPAPRRSSTTSRAASSSSTLRALREPDLLPAAIAAAARPARRRGARGAGARGAAPARARQSSSRSSDAARRARARCWRGAPSLAGPGDEPRAAAHRRRARAAGRAARARRRDRAVRGARPRGAARLRGRASLADGVRAARPAAARARARRRARPGRCPPRGWPRASSARSRAGRRAPRRRRAPADAAGDDRLELRPARRAGAERVRAGCRCSPAGSTDGAAESVCGADAPALHELADASLLVASRRALPDARARPRVRRWRSSLAAGECTGCAAGTRSTSRRSPRARPFARGPGGGGLARASGARARQRARRAAVGGRARTPASGSRSPRRSSRCGCAAPPAGGVALAVAAAGRSAPARRPTCTPARWRSPGG